MPPVLLDVLAHLPGGRGSHGDSTERKRRGGCCGMVVALVDNPSQNVNLPWRGRPARFWRGPRKVTKGLPQGSEYEREKQEAAGGAGTMEG